MATHTAVVRPDGMILVPVDEARPGEIVTIRIERSISIDADRKEAAAGESQGLTKATADTPEKRELLIQQTLELGRRIRAQLTEEELNFDHDAWMYDENGAPR